MEIPAKMGTNHFLDYLSLVEEYAFRIAEITVFAVFLTGLIGCGGGGNSGTRAQTQSSCSPHAVFSVASGYVVQNNAYNVTESGQSGAQQCITVNTLSTSWSETTNVSVPTTDEPSGYPSIYAGCNWGACSSDQYGMPMQVSQIASAPTTWSVTPSTSGTWDVAYDIWLNANEFTSDNESGDPVELMIWINHAGPRNPWENEIASSVPINGMTWDIWTGISSDESTGESWNIVNYEAVSPVTSVGLDLENFFHDMVSRKLLSTSYYLIAVEAGTEIWMPGSSFATNSFSVSIVGGSQPTVTTGTATSVANRAVPRRALLSIRTDWTRITHALLVRLGASPTLGAGASRTSSTDAGSGMSASAISANISDLAQEVVGNWRSGIAPV